ncbi:MULTISPECIES: M3 family oligoendopeptidase [unclassified Roseitalea]|uniref:M3 family oligoendopeptidase n=1 Tax=unclassified Roseitalea TaxID=2639107 RepID=UPI00273E17D4|nr:MULTISPECIES: M3 family oligoendopeptidase [unclassified Roseitalea]
MVTRATAAPAQAPGRPELGELPQWRLGDLYESTDAPALKRDLDAVAEQARAFEQAWQGELDAAARAGRLGEAVTAYEELEDLSGRIASFASLLYAADTSDPARAKFYGDVQQHLTATASHLLFFELELNRIEEAVLEAAFAQDTVLARYRPWISDLRLEKPYQLEDRLEQLFLDKSVTSAVAFHRLFDETMTGLRFDVDGEQLPLEPTLNKLQDADRTVREKAFGALAGTFGDNVRMFTLITNTLAKDKEISDRWRGFEDVADARHLSNRVEREVVEALVEAVRGGFGRISHRYYAMKANWLGMETMDAWDRNAPLPETPQAVIGWDEARNIVLSAYHGFSPQMADIARRFFDQGWIDAPTRPGKSPGAFSHPTVPSAHPYILLNYLGKPRDVMTLAHELGHGVHQVLAAEQGALMAQTPLTLAETASVFGEMLTFRSMLARTDERAERKAMLAHKAEDMINTVIRQIAFYLFERKVHLARREGELTSEQLGRFWVEVQSESLGPAIRLNPGYEHFWSYVPHFIRSPFYVYAYAFGDCLVNSLYAVYQRADSGFQDAYFDMLRAGGTKHHRELLAPFGLDATDPDFWAKGLGVIEAIVDELEAMDA